MSCHGTVFAAYPQTKQSSSSTTNIKITKLSTVSFVEVVECTVDKEKEIIIIKRREGV
jgi:hypothetical protein